jgi:hypothetical protein
MGLLKDWRDHAYGLDDRTPEGEKFWLHYFEVEKGIYRILLADISVVMKGTVKNLAEKFETDIETMTGFIDGINDSLSSPVDIDNMTEDTEVQLAIDPEKLYMNMVGCNAEWLYKLPEWDAIFTQEKRDELYKLEKKSHTVIKPPKVGRNDPCPCGSGKKFKKCCGANA